MSCNNQITVTDRILCAVTCTTKFNVAPIAALSYTGETLFDNSTFFDQGDISNRQVNWKIYVDDTLIYDFGFGNYYDTVPELSNGSIYSILILGGNNEGLTDFISSLPNTIIPNNTTFTVYVDVKDDTGILNNNTSNKFIFNN